uniref:Uncharacterized protein n=1 Tax=Clandestinovirus TaxID=2831644 RepID=A0A8F8KPE0_9VIRU|nr:hypothetical protein KOM_12_85 [Clandestinovirus]
MDDVNWLTDVLPLEVLHQVIPYCAIELYQVSTFIRGYIIDNMLLFEDRRVKHVKIPVQRWLTGSKHHILHSMGITLKDDIQKLTLLEWSIVTESTDLLKMIMTIPQTNLCAQHSRAVKLAIEHDKVDALKIISGHKTFNNAMTVDKVAMTNLLRLCEYDTFVAVFEDTRVKPTPEHWMALMDKSTNLDQQKMKMRYLLTVYDRYNTPFGLDITLNQMARLGTELREELVKRPYFMVSSYQNAFLKAINCQFKQTLNANGRYTQVIQSIVTHPQFSWINTNASTIVSILHEAHTANKQVGKIVLESINPEVINIPQLLLESTRYYQPLLPVFEKQFPDHFDFVTHDELNAILESPTYRHDHTSQWTAIDFWSRRGFMPSPSVIASLARYHTIQSLIEKETFPAKPVMAVIKARKWESSILVQNLIAILNHSTISTNEDILPFVEFLILSPERSHLSVLKSLVQNNIFDPTWNNYYYVKMVWQIDTNYGYEKFAVMTESKSMKRAFMQKDILYDEINQTISFRVHPKRTK